VNKTLKQKGYSLSQNKDVANWGGLDSFEVGRPVRKNSEPLWRKICMIGMIMYLLFGLCLWVGVKVFSSRRKAYRFATVVFKWPKMFKALI